MSRPVVISFLWPKNYPVLLELAAKASVDIAAPVSLVPPAVGAALANAGRRFIPLLSSDYATLAAGHAQEAAARTERIAKKLPEILFEPALATAESSSRTRAIIEQTLPDAFRDTMAMIDELDAVHAREQVVGVLVNETDLAAGKLAALWAKERGVPSFLLSHGGNIGTAYTITRAMHADYLLVFGSRGTETYRDIGIPAESMLIAGNPAWDRYPGVLQARAQYRADAYARLGLRVDEPMVVFATIWNTRLTALLDAQIFEQTVRAFIQGCKRLREMGTKFNAVIKDRPSNVAFGKDEVARIASEEGFTDYAYGGGDMEVYIAAADLLVSNDSNVFVEAMIGGVPSINLWTPSSWLIGPGFSRENGIPMIQVSNTQALAEVMQATLTDKVFRASLVEQMAAALPAFHLAMDGGSVARTVEAISGLLKPAPVQPAPPSVPPPGHASSGPPPIANKLIAMLQRAPRTVLEVGAGDLGPEFMRTFAGITLHQLAPRNVFVGDLSAANLQLGTIDTVVLSHALEEMYAPEQFLMNLRPYLTADAQVVASIPNVRNLWLITELLSGRWESPPGDLLDFARIRFFTLKSAIALFTQAGYSVDRLEHTVDPRIPEIAAPASGTMNVDMDVATLKALASQDIFELRALAFIMLARVNSEVL